MARAGGVTAGGRKRRQRSLDGIARSLSGLREVGLEPARDRGPIPHIGDHKRLAAAPAIFAVEEPPKALATIQILAALGVYYLRFGNQRKAQRAPR